MSAPKLDTARAVALLKAWMSVRPPWPEGGDERVRVAIDAVTSAHIKLVDAVLANEEQEADA